MSLSVSKVVDFSHAPLKFPVQDEDEEDNLQDRKLLGGVFSNTDYAWVSKGPHLQVIRTGNGNKVGSWTSGWALKDPTTKIVCVDEIFRPLEKHPLLAVGFNSELGRGMICIIDFLASRALRTIQLRDKITSLHVVDCGYSGLTLPGPLGTFDGIIAVGTSGGDVHLIDICSPMCEGDEASLETNPSSLHDITVTEISRIEYHKQISVTNNQHLAIHLNAVSDNSNHHFTLKGPKGEDRIHVNKEEVTVSALHYCPQLGSLLIGYNFGAFQLFNLINLQLVYTSPVCEEHIPISHFAFQEPSDDPRAFCYIWAVYSWTEQYQPSLPLAVMYAFSYHTKEYHEGYGYLYQDFSGTTIQFQMELGVPVSKNMVKARGGICLRLNSIHHGRMNKEVSALHSNEDSLTLCVLGWTVWYSNMETETFLAIFDLNQWYKEQMPNIPNPQNSSVYMIELAISDIINSSTDKVTPILDLQVDKKNLKQFVGAQRLEEHFCPNSVSMDICCLRENNSIILHNYGAQNVLLTQIESIGPSCLIEPAEIFQEIVGLGLVPLFVELPVDVPVSSDQQREIILSTTLESQLLGWLCKCASEVANGCFLAAGCSLDFLITWAFQRATTLKVNCDHFCVPLFDHSERQLDTNPANLLSNCIRQLSCICSFYFFIITKLGRFVSNLELVNEQFKSLQMVSEYFQVLQWFLNVGLLPEHPFSSYPRTDEQNRMWAPYPAELLAEFYNHRRALLNVSSDERTSESLLFIDHLLEKECGGKNLQAQWRLDGGNGLYPPPSLQSLLRTYLVENVDLSYKHLVTMYVFLDLAMTLDQESYKPVITYLIKFPAVFKVEPSIIKIMQGFWQLDHGDFNTGMGLLLDPLVSSQYLGDWHNRIVLKSLCLQKQFDFALLYVESQSPQVKTEDDLKAVITLYISNNMIDEAFYFTRCFSTPGNETKLLTHLFNECMDNHTLRTIIYRSLTLKEEELFLQYLQKDRQTSSEDLNVFYHILRTRFIEAFESDDLFNHSTQGLLGQRNAIFREKIVAALKTLLPGVHIDLLNLCRSDKPQTWQQVVRPTPMSVFVLNQNESVQSKSTVIAAAMAKAKQTFYETLNSSRLQTETTPFLRTPKATTDSRRQSHIVCKPKLLDLDDEPELASPSPAKRMRLSPRQIRSSILPAKLDTPIVKRKLPRFSFDNTVSNATPHSILKVKTRLSSGDFEDDFERFTQIEYTPVTSQDKKAGLGLSPRKSLRKPSPAVRFEELKNSSRNTIRELPKVIERVSPNVSSDSVKRLSGGPSTNASSEDEVFYSPETSFENKEMNKANSENVCKMETDENLSDPFQSRKSLKRSHDNREVEKCNKGEEITQHEEKSLAPASILSKELEEKKPSSILSPKGRRSYRRSLGKSSPTRSSPRLSQKTSKADSPSKPIAEDLSDDSSKATQPETTPSEPLNPSKSLPKLHPRRSLCRQVLETNTLNRVLIEPSTPQKETKLVVTTTEEKKEITRISLLESSSKFEDGEEIKQSTSLEKQTRNFTVFEETQEGDQESSRTSRINRKLDFTKIGEQTIVNELQLNENSNTQEVQNEEEGKDDVITINETTVEQEKTKTQEIQNEEKENDGIISINETTVEQEKSISKDVSLNRAEAESENYFANRQLDPEMNVFEISDDLDINAAVVNEEQMSLNETDMCYGQQNTLENVMEENLSGNSTKTLNEFETNIFDETSFSSKDSDEEIRQDKRAEAKKEVSVTEPENEVIEIGSSTDESSDNSRTSDQSRHSYHRNIYDTLSEAVSPSVSESERSYSEISRGSNESGDHQGELFYGTIVVEDKTPNVTLQTTSIVEESAVDLVEEDDSEDGNNPGRQLFKSLVSEEGSDGKASPSLSNDTDKDDQTDEEDFHGELFHGQILSEDLTVNISEDIQGDDEEISLRIEENEDEKEETKEPFATHDREVKQKASTRLSKRADSDDERLQGELFHGQILSEELSVEISEKEKIEDLQGDDEEISLRIEENEDEKEETKEPFATHDREVKQKASTRLSKRADSDDERLQGELFHGQILSEELSVEISEKEKIEDLQGDDEEISLRIEENEDEKEETKEPFATHDREVKQKASTRLSKRADSDEERLQGELFHGQILSEELSVNISEKEKSEDLQGNGEEILLKIDEDEEQETKEAVEMQDQINQKTVASKSRDADSNDQLEKDRLHGQIVSEDVSVSVSEERKSENIHGDEEILLRIDENEDEENENVDTIDEEITKQRSVGQADDKPVTEENKIPRSTSTATEQGDEENVPKIVKKGFEKEKVPSPVEEIIQKSQEDQQQNIEEDLTTDLKVASGSAEKKKKPKPRKRAVSVESKDLEELPTTRQRKRKAGTSETQKPEAVIEDVPVSQPKKRKGRTQSADAKLETALPIRRSRRNKNVEVGEVSSVQPRRQRNSSADKSPVVEETGKEVQRKTRAVSEIPEDKGAKPAAKKSRSTIADYSESRRMTRRQVVVLKKTLGDDDKNIDLRMLDPIVLLDRPQFEGEVDPEEKKIYEDSGTSSGSPSSPKPVRRLRSASQTSERSPSKEPSPKLAKRSLRKKSTDGTSNVSTESTSKNKKDAESESNAKLSTRGLRSRSKSISSTVSGQSVSSEVTRSLRNRTVTSLPDIPEEPPKTPTKRRTRKDSTKK